jgi:MFS family permease
MGWLVETHRMTNNIVGNSRIPHWLRDNLSILSATGFLSGIHTNMVSVVWQPFALSLGASIPMLGLLTSLGGFGGIVTSLVQPLGGWLADRMGRKPFIVWASVVLISGYALYTLAGLTRAWTLLIPGILLLGISQLSRPARTSITAESVGGQRGTGASCRLLPCCRASLRPSSAGSLPTAPRPPPSIR